MGIENFKMREARLMIILFCPDWNNTVLSSPYCTETEERLKGKAKRSFTACNNSLKTLNF